MQTRDYWLQTLQKITSPVLSSLATGTLKATMPVDTGVDASYCGRKPGDHAGAENIYYTHLQAFARTMVGIGPWLDAPGLVGEEAARQATFRDYARAAVGHATNPDSPDYLNFTHGVLPLCDAAILAQGLLRSWSSVWMHLDRDVQQRAIACLRGTRAMEAYFNNWLLFSAMIEAFLCQAGEEWDWMRVEYALRQCEQWYVGDGVYSDGANFHWDYYNSYVIHPMLLAIVDTVSQATGRFVGFKDVLHQRAQRFAAVQERLIMPDGAFPPIGRSLAYRSGAFHCLADMALRQELPTELTPAQVRSALTAMLHRSLEAEGTFDADGWLTIGFYGHQPSICEDYMCTGAVYLCTAAFLPLGLPPEDEFWSAPDTDWTAKTIWSGGVKACDHAIREVRCS